ncbi:MAG: transposase [Planctomycetota bacterium]
MVVFKLWWLMYNYRTLTEKQQAEVVGRRKRNGLPLHAPPHFHEGSHIYLLTAANYNHVPIMTDENRRKEFKEKLLTLLAPDTGFTIHAWCILPNHYHVVTEGTLAVLSKTLGRLHNGTATQWNREDAVPGRKVWYRFNDRRIRTEAHFWVAVNYVHANAVHHGYVQTPSEWSPGSLHAYVAEYGPDRIRDLWNKYPVLDMGKGWDDQGHEHALRR